MTESNTARISALTQLDHYLEQVGTGDFLHRRGCDALLADIETCREPDFAAMEAAEEESRLQSEFDAAFERGGMQLALSRPDRFDVDAQECPF